VTAAKVRVSFAPLLRASRIAEEGGVRITFSIPTNNFGTGGPGHDQECKSVLSALAELLGVNYRTLLRWRKAGVPISEAEDLSFMLGTHPAVIWGEEWIFAAGCPLAKRCALLGLQGNQRVLSTPNPQDFPTIGRDENLGQSVA